MYVLAPDQVVDGENIPSVYYYDVPVSTDANTDSSFRSVRKIESTSPVKAMVYKYSASSSIIFNGFLAVSPVPNTTASYCRYDDGVFIPEATVTQQLNRTYTYNNKTVYYNIFGVSPNRYSTPLVIVNDFVNQYNRIDEKLAWAMLYGDYGVPITYALSGCTGAEFNPLYYDPREYALTTQYFPNEGKGFTEDSVSVAMEGVEPEDIDFTWDSSAGILNIYDLSGGALSITVRAEDGYAVTYSMSGCVGDQNNPSTIMPGVTSTTMKFTANENRAFTEESVHIAGTGYPEGDIQFNWNPETGVLVVGQVASAVSVSVLAKVVDPYDDGGHTEPEDGNGSFDFTGDDVEMSTLPTVSFDNTGFVRIYNPTLAQLSSLASYMWTDTTFVQTVINHAKQLLENPIESIISLNLLPCPIPNGTSEEVKVLFIPTGVYMPPATAQFVEVDCGSVQLTEVYGSALDYSPYTKVHCFLPYIGTVTLDTDEVMGKTISVKYRIDVATGVCVAHILVNGNVFYQFSGHCAVAMPLTSADFSTYISAAIGTAKAVAGVAAAGAGAGGVAAGLTGSVSPRSTTKKSTQTVRNPSTGRQITAGTTTTETETHGATFGEIAAKAVSNTVASVMGSKTIVEHSGGFTGNSGYMGVRRPYLVVEVPRIANPENYSKYNGYPSMITTRLGDCTGYTEVQSVHLTGFGATNSELTQIGELLKAGVLL